MPPRAKQLASRGPRKLVREPRTALDTQVFGPQRITSVAELGAIVRATRRFAGLDQAQAAGRLGVGTRFLGDLERGKPTVRLGLVFQVLRRLGLELSVSPRDGKPT